MEKIEKRERKGREKIVCRGFSQKKLFKFLLRQKTIQIKPFNLQIKNNRLNFKFILSSVILKAGRGEGGSCMFNCSLMH